jgi:hypothetical protein
MSKSLGRKYSRTACQAFGQHEMALQTHSTAKTFTDNVRHVSLNTLTSCYTSPLLPSKTRGHHSGRARHIPDQAKRIVVRVSVAFVLQRLSKPIRDRFSVHVANPCVSRVQSRGDAATGEDIAVFDPASCRNPRDVWTGGCGPRPSYLVRGCFATVQDTGASKDGRSSADADDVLEL